MREYIYFVYIVASNSRTLYIGVTSDLSARMFQHKEGVFEGFTKTYKCHRLVYFERWDDISEAINREKQLKRWRRGKKIFLIEQDNPTWEDLSADWHR
jgi:putative endonuclease